MPEGSLVGKITCCRGGHLFLGSYLLPGALVARVCVCVTYCPEAFIAGEDPCTPWRVIPNLCSITHTALVYKYTVFLPFFCLCNRRKRQYKTLESVGLMEKRAETLSFRNSSWSDDDDNDDEALLISKEKAANVKHQFAGYNNPISPDEITFHHKDSGDPCFDDLMM